MPGPESYTGTRAAKEFLQRPGVDFEQAGDYIVPYVEKLLPDSPTVIIFPGWCGLLQPEDPANDEFNNMGVGVIQLGTPIPIDSRRKTLKPDAQIADDIDVFSEVIKRRIPEDEEKILAGCSLGGLSAINVTARNPKGVSDLVLINPAIRHPVDNTFWMGARYFWVQSGEAFEHIREEGFDGLAGQLKVLGEAVGHPMDSIHRGFGIIHATETAAQLVGLADVKQTIILGNGDGIFHPQKTETKLRKEITKVYHRDKYSEDEHIVYDSYLENIIMPRFVTKNGGHDLRLTGEEFAQMILREMAITQERHERAEKHLPTRYTAQNLVSLIRPESTLELGEAA